MRKVGEGALVEALQLDARNMVIQVCSYQSITEIVTDDSECIWCQFFFFTELGMLCKNILLKNSLSKQLLDFTTFFFATEAERLGFSMTCSEGDRWVLCGAATRERGRLTARAGLHDPLT